MRLDELICKVNPEPNQDLNKWELIAENQAYIIEDLSAMCRELIQNLQAYQRTERVTDDLEEILGRKVNL